MEIIKRWLTQLPETWTDLIARLLFRELPDDCGCVEMAERMNEGGVEWCREHYAEILARLETNGVNGCRFGIGPLLRLPIRWQAKRWIDEAIPRQH